MKSSNRFTSEFFTTYNLGERGIVMKKLKINLIIFFKIISLFLAFFIFSPSLQAKASFSDTDNINMGITLELGSISLATEDTNIIDPVCFTEGGPVLIASSKLVNDGSLSGKLAYKIDVTEGNRVLTADELKNTMISIEFGTEEIKVEATAANLNTNSFAFIKNASVSDIVIEPNSVGKVPVTVSYKSSTPTKEEKIEVKVTFKLIQSNAKDANVQLFSDEEVVSNKVLLVPKVIEPESYWPEEQTFIQKNGFSYSLKNMKMLFSETNETFDKNKRQIKNLNKAVLYIQLPKDVPLTETVKKDDGTTVTKDTFIITKLLTTLKTENEYNTGNQALVEESRVLDKVHHGIIITFRLQDEYSYNSSNPSDSLKYANNDRYSLNIDIEIQKYSMYKQGEYGYYSNFSDYLQFFATRMVLSSDTEVPISGVDYIQAPIKLTNEKRMLTFKNFYTTSPQYVKPDYFKDVKFTNEIIELEVVGVNKEQVSYSQASINDFSLWLNSNKAFNGAILNVKITGDSGNTLVISRKLIASTEYRLMENKFFSAPRGNQEFEQQVDVEISEESTQPKDGTSPDEQISEVPDEEVTEEEAIEESVIDPPIEEVVEPDDTVPEPLEGTNQIASEEKISDEQINE